MTGHESSIAAQQLHGAGMTTTLAFLAAGLGQFFIGVKLLGKGVKESAGPGLRHLLTKVTRRTWAASGLGIGLGSITQSASVATFLMASMVGAGLLGLRAAMPVVQWSNVGASALVFLATLDVTVAMFFLLGVVGLLYYLNLDERRSIKPFLTSGFGFALLFIGISDTQTASTMLSTEPWFRSTMEFIRTYSIVHFFFGTALSYVARSSASASVIAIAFAQSGLITEFDAVVLILGANTGTGLVAFELSFRVQGAPRQLLVYQFVSKLIGLLVVGAFLILDDIFGWNLVLSALAWSAPTLDLRLAVAYLAIQLVSCLVMSPFYGTSQRLLERYFPEPSDIALGKPRFLYAAAVDDPASALHLLSREQVRLALRLPRYFRHMAGKPVAMGESNIDKVHAANASLLDEMDEFSNKLGQRDASAPVYDRILTTRGITNTLREIDAEAHSLAKRCDAFTATKEPSPDILKLVRDIGSMFARLTEQEIRLLVSGREEDLDKLDRKLLRHHKPAVLAQGMMSKLHGKLTPAEGKFALELVTAIWQLDSLAKRLLAQQRRLL